MKNASHAINTLSPVRRVTAFFAFLGFLTIASCGEKEFDQTAIMEEQAEAFSEMAAIMDSVSDGSDPRQQRSNFKQLPNAIEVSNGISPLSIIPRRRQLLPFPATILLLSPASHILMPFLVLNGQGRVRRK